MTPSLSLTSDAQECFDRYLARVRYSLTGTSVDSDEVEHDVREHIASALGGTGEITRQRLEGVLSDLGSPESWVPDEQLPVWRRFVNQVRSGPEDWRLAYLTFAFTALGVLLIPVLGPLGLFVAYLTARATRAVASEAGDELGARRWLVDPILIAAAVMILCSIMLGPPAGVAVGLLESGIIADSTGILPLGDDATAIEVVSHIAMYLLAIGAWWLILTPLAVWGLKPLRWLTVPIGDGLEKRHLVWLAGLGLLLVIIAAVTLQFV